MIIVTITLQRHCFAPIEGGTPLQKAAPAAVTSAASTIAAIAAAVRAASAEHAAPKGRPPAAPAVPDELRLLFHHLQLHIAFQTLLLIRAPQYRQRQHHRAIQKFSLIEILTEGLRP